MKYYIARKAKGRPFDCTGCKNEKCLYKGPVEVQTSEKDDDGAWIKKVINNVDEMWNYIDSVVAEGLKRGHHPIEFDILWGYGHRVCPLPLIDPDTINLYEAVELSGAPAPRDIIHQPWVYIRAKNIIEAEKARMEKLWPVTQSP